jgi:hypothetical protein
LRALIISNPFMIGMLRSTNTTKYGCLQQVYSFALSISKPFFPSIATSAPTYSVVTTCWSFEFTRLFGSIFFNINFKLMLLNMLSSIIKKHWHFLQIPGGIASGIGKSWT